MLLNSNWLMAHQNITEQKPISLQGCIGINRKCLSSFNGTNVFYIPSKLTASTDVMLSVKTAEKYFKA
jgi:hypothetical protein